MQPETFGEGFSREEELGLEGYLRFPCRAEEASKCSRHGQKCVGGDMAEDDLSIMQGKEGNLLSKGFGTL